METFGRSISRNEKVQSISIATERKEDADQTCSRPQECTVLLHDRHDVHKHETTAFKFLFHDNPEYT